MLNKFSSASLQRIAQEIGQDFVIPDQSPTSDLNEQLAEEFNKAVQEAAQVVARNHPELSDEEWLSAVQYFIENKLQTTMQWFGR